MNARDLAAELAAEDAAKELNALRALRDDVLTLADALQKCARYQQLTDGERKLLTIYFDENGYGPISTARSETVRDLAALARVAKEAQR